MTAESLGQSKAFQRAIYVSALLHAALFIVIFASPSLTPTPNKGFVQYINFMGFPGGGEGTGGGPAGGGAESVVANPQPLPPAKTRETLRDLTVPQKAKAESADTMRYPVEKPKNAKKTPEKKAVITKSAPSATEAAATETGAAGQKGSQAGGFGLRFGTGGTGGGGTGGGSGTGGDPNGLSGFPFTYYLQIISDRITSNWFNSLVDPGAEGQFQTQVGFKIYRNGQVADLKVEVSSGFEAFDPSAQRAIQTAAPFPALPSEYDGQYLVIHLIFEHAK